MRKLKKTIATENGDKELLAKLNSGKPTDIIAAIKKLREVGNVNYLPDLFGVYDASLSELVKKELSNFICDLKDASAAPYIVHFLEGIELEEDREWFMSCCWQSRVDFCKQSGFFVDSIISGSYQTSIEAFTVIEDCLDKIGQEELALHIQSLKNALSEMDDEKRIFVKVIIDSLQAVLGM